MEGSRNSKSGSPDPFLTPFDLILYFFTHIALVGYMRAKFVVSSFMCSRDMERVPKFQK